MDDFWILKSIMTALQLNLVGDDLKTFVINSTGCSNEDFVKIYNEVIDAWIT